MARDHRRLAAIVSADVVGYSLLMGRDDSATLAGLQAHRRELIDPKIAEYSGRIGINVGDIIIDGDDIFGDGVNVAARLQTLAEPGRICVSRMVRDQVLDKLSFAFEDLGSQQVKNIARPVEAYRVDLGSGAQAEPGRRRWQQLARGPWRWFAAGVVVLSAAGIAVWVLPEIWMPKRAAAPPALSVGPQ